MGNCHIHERNKEEVGRIEILLDKTRISRGDSITGRLKLFLKKEYPGRQLSVRIRGIESIKKGIEFAENEIFGDTILLVAVNQMKEGEHKFFFEYTVPDKLQAQFSSRVISELPAFAVSMVYQIKGILEPVELVQDEFEKIEGASYFTLLAEVQQDGISSNSTGKLKNEHGEYGNVEIGLHSNKAAYDGLEQVNVDITMNNSDVTIPLESLSFNLVKETQFLGKTKNQYLKSIRRDFQEEPIKEIIISQDIKFERGELEQTATKTVNFELPNSLQPSFQGKQFSCKYFFELYAHYVKAPTNFIDAKARLKLNIIPEKMRNIVDPSKKIEKASKLTSSMYKSKIKSNFYQSQMPYYSANKDQLQTKQLDETVNHNVLTKSNYATNSDQKEVNIIV